MSGCLVKRGGLTIREVLQEARLIIPLAEAEYLAMGLFGLSRVELYLSERRLTPKEGRRFFSLVGKAREGMPVQYLVNSAPFLDLDIYVDRRVFIPRPETEELVLRASARVREPKVILDYGTGSGCIAIALARLFPDATVFGVDASRSALQVAKINIRRYHLENRVRLLWASSLRSELFRAFHNRVDLLISNPPYIPKARLARLPLTVREYEPRIALDGGEDGIEVITMIWECGQELLKPGGLLAVEIDSSQGEYVQERFAKAEVESDVYGRVRYLFWQKGGQDENRLGD